MTQSPNPAESKAREKAPALSGDRPGVGPKPEEYIAELIRAINDNAKIARTTGLALLLTALYIAAAIFSATDEAILRGSAAKVGQLGIDIPLVLSFSLAPPIFVFLHVNALIQFDLLARQLRRLGEQFDRHRVSEDDRAHYLSLLTSSAFVPLVAMREPALGVFYADRVRRVLYAAIEWLTITGIPVATLLVAQLGFLRQQDAGITTMHTVVLAIDLLTISWFYGRRPVPRRLMRWLHRFDNRRPGTLLRRVSAALGAPGWPSLPATGVSVAILGFMIAFGQVASPHSRTVLGRDGGGDRGGSLADLLSQPVDSLLCEHLSERFCRRLVLPYKTLLANEVDAATLSELRERTVLWDKLERIVGLDLRGRTLRFADLRQAALWRVNLSNADLTGAVLDHAGLGGAQLDRSILNAASLAGANLTYADLAGSSLDDATLVGATLRVASLQMARMRRADMRVTQLRDAKLNFADLDHATLIGACVRASLNGAWLANADLRGADLTGSDLRGATLANARIWGADGGAIMLGPTDLRRLVATRGTDQPVDAISESSIRLRLGRVEPHCDPDPKRRALEDESSHAVAALFRTARVHGPILVDSPADEDDFQKLTDPSNVTRDTSAYATAFVSFLATTACHNMPARSQAVPMDQLVLSNWRGPGFFRC